MKIIISPTKQMKVETDILAELGSPMYREESKSVLDYLSSLSADELKTLWKCNDKIAAENVERLADMKSKNLPRTPAILAYDGIAFKYMAPEVFEFGQFDYVQENLRILSAFYGVLRPMDGIVPYRLEMQAKAAVEGSKDLYSFWGEKIYEGVADESHVIINLASKEYSKCLEKYLRPGDRFINLNFVERVGEKLVTKGVYAKMCRGEMVRLMAEKNVKTPEELKELVVLDHHYSEADSKDHLYTFIKE